MLAIRLCTYFTPIANLRGVQLMWQQELDKPVADMERVPMLSGQILTACNEFFDDDAILAIDGGNTVLLALQSAATTKLANPALLADVSPFDVL